MKPCGPTDWFEALQAECQFAEVPVPWPARLTFDTAERIIRWFTLRVARRARPWLPRRSIWRRR
jgi:hypothetical protein